MTSRFMSFEARCSDLHDRMSEEKVLSCVTEITGVMWGHMTNEVGLEAVFSYGLNKKDSSGATTGNSRPDETDYLNDFLVCKSEHKTADLMLAISELKDKLVGYNQIEYGFRIVYLPVIAAAGTQIEFGLIDARTKVYHHVRRFNLSIPNGRAMCFAMAISVFRLIATMEPHIPLNSRPLFQDKEGITFYEDHVTKKILVSFTCPDELYELLRRGQVPSAAKVEKGRRVLKISPVGVRIRNEGQGLNLQEVKKAMRSTLACLRYIHDKGYVHRDLRWPNLIIKNSYSPDGSVDDSEFIVIDFEFAACTEDPMEIADYISRDVVPHGQPFQTHHDLKLLGKMVETWAASNIEMLDAEAKDFVSTVKKDTATASRALGHKWLAMP